MLICKKTRTKRFIRISDPAKFRVSALQKAYCKFWKIFKAKRFLFRDKFQNERVIDNHLIYHQNSCGGMMSFDPLDDVVDEVEVIEDKEDDLGFAFANFKMSAAML